MNPETITTPRYDAYAVRDYKDKEGKDGHDWTRCGVAFPHKDGKGFRLVLTAVPLNGQIVLREHDSKPE